MKDKLSVLAIDDNRDNLLILDALIHEAFPECKLLKANSGAQGLELAALEIPDVILLDIVMPMMNGFQVCTALKDNPALKDIPVVFITALKGDKENRIQAMEVGAEAFLTKPVDKSELTAQIKAMAKIREANVFKLHENERLSALVEKRTGELKRELERRGILEQQLRNAADDWESTFNSIRDGIALVDADHNILRTNKAFEAFVGLDADKMVGHHCYRFIHGTTQPVKNCPLRLMFDSGERKVREMEISGRVFEIQVDPLWDEVGNLSGAVHVMSDITERKTGERIRQIQLNIVKAVLEKDSMEELLSFIKMELGEIMDTSCFSLVLFDDEGLVGNYFPDPHSENPQISEVDDYFVRASGSSLEPVLYESDDLQDICNLYPLLSGDDLPKQWIGVPLRSNNHSLGMMILQSRDPFVRYTAEDIELLSLVSNELVISIERLKTREELIRAKEKAEENDRLKTAFLANMSHEIRTPMNGILGFTDILKDANLNPESRNRILHLIEKSSHRLFNLINDLLDISLIESGQLTHHPVPIHLDTEGRLLAELFLPDAAAKDIILTFLPDPSPKTEILYSDKTKLISVWSNLIKNGIKFTEKGEVVFGYQIIDPWVRFFVKDTGIGIPDEKQKIIFDRFVQADNRMNRGYEGAGLGLSIAKAYVHFLGGVIGLNSTPGQGSEFWFTLPSR